MAANTASAAQLNSGADVVDPPQINQRHWRFSQEYLVDGNGTQAAIRAGYSPKSAHVTACRLLKDANVRALIGRARDEIEAELKLRIMGPKEVLKRLSEIAQGDIGNLLEIGEDGQPIDDLISLKTAKEQGKSHLIKRLRKRTTTTTLETGRVIETVEAEAEMYSAHDALRDLAKHHGLFVEPAGPTIVVPIAIIRMDPSEV